MTWSANREAVAETSEAMVAALTAFAGAQSERQILTLQQTILVSLFDAARTELLTRNGSVAASHRFSRLAGGTSESVHVIRPEIEERMLRGAVFATDAPAVDLPGVPVPETARHAVLVPCSSIAATNAICAFWDERRPPLAQVELDQLRALATVAGLAFDRYMADAQARILRARLENRVRNVLAVIRSVGTRSAERAPTLEEFLLHFEGRIDAIGRSQLAGTRDGEISFELLLREELLAQAIQDEPHVSLEGMDVAITSEQAEALGLAMHELAVNAVKFGALAGPGGSLAVRWWVESRAESLALNIDWRERCGLHVIPGRRDRAGFGLTYLEHALPFQLNAEVTLGFLRQGLRCQIAVPLHRTPVLRARPAPDGPAQQRRAQDWSGRSGGDRRKIDLVRK